MFRQRLLVAPYYGRGETGPRLNTTSTTLSGTKSWDDMNEQQLCSYYRDYQCLASSYGASFTPRLDYGAEAIVGSVGRDRRQFRNVRHSSTRLVSLPYLKCIAQQNGYYGQKPNYLSYYTRYNSSDVPSSSRLVKTVGKVEGIERRMDYTESSSAYWSMLPRFQGNIDLFRSLVELRDFRDCLSIFGRAYPALRRLAYEAMGTRWRQSKPYATGYLAWKLAIEPTVADFIKVAQQCVYQAEQLQQKYALAGSVWQSSHYTQGWKTVEQEGTPGTGTYYFLVNSGSCMAYIKTATLAYKYNYSPRHGYDLFKQFWGLELTLENIYQLIPMSFVLDMFITLGRSIRYMKTDTATHISELQYCESFKAKGGCGAFIVPTSLPCRFVVDGDFYGFCRPPIHLHGWAYTLYDRAVRVPNKGPALPLLKLPSGGQALTLAAITRCFLP